MPSGFWAMDYDGDFKTIAFGMREEWDGFFLRMRSPRGLNDGNWITLGMEFEDDFFSWMVSLGSFKRRSLMFPNMKCLWKRVLE